MALIKTAFAASLALSTGCFWFTTKSEGEGLRKDVTTLQSKIDTKEKDLSTEVDQLKSTLDEASKILKRNSADIGADVQSLKDDMRNVRGLITASKSYADDIGAKVDAQSAKIDALSARVDALEKIAAGNSVGGTPTIGANPDDLWQQGKDAFGAQRWDEARDAFKKLVVGFPDHPKASQAQYFRAEAYFQQKQYDAAIAEFQKVVDKYGTSDLADDALFREGESAEALLHCTEARAYFGLLGQKYPKSNLVKKAQDKDKQLKKEAKDKSKCSS
jgi:tol-pal system protein YbgF